MIKQILSILASKMFGSSEPRKKYKQERSMNVIITLILTICVLVAFRRKNVRGVVVFFALIVLHNIFPDGYIHVATGIYAAIGVVLTILFYTTQALMQVMGYKPTVYILKQISHDHTS